VSIGGEWTTFKLVVLRMERGNGEVATHFGRGGEQAGNLVACQASGRALSLGRRWWWWGRLPKTNTPPAQAASTSLCARLTNGPHLSFPSSACSLSPVTQPPFPAASSRPRRPTLHLEMPHQGLNSPPPPSPAFNPCINPFLTSCPPPLQWC
jgi:hypothetical protein